jgi:hypothetical protein
MAFKYSTGTLLKTLRSSPATSHLRSTPSSSADKRTIRRSCSVACMLADWNPNRSFAMSPVVGGVSLNCGGSAAYIVSTLSMTAGSDMDAGVNRDHTCEVPLADEKRRRLPSTTYSRIRYRSVVKFQPRSHATGCRDTTVTSSGLTPDSGDTGGRP